jgi:hypothetical protein
MLITYPDGSTELVAAAVRVDQQDFHEGTFDFYDGRIDMGSGVKWDLSGLLRHPLLWC